VLWLVLVIVVLALLVAVGARGRARSGEQLSDRAEAQMDEQFEKPRDEGDLL